MVEAIDAVCGLGVESRGVQASSTEGSSSRSPRGRRCRWGLWEGLPWKGERAMIRSRWTREGDWAWWAIRLTTIGLRRPQNFMLEA